MVTTILFQIEWFFILPNDDDDNEPKKKSAVLIHIAGNNVLG